MLISTAQDKDVPGEIIKTEDVALLRILVVKEKETVMVQGMEVSMMVMLGAEETWCVAVTTARSLDLITMRKMIAVTFLSLFKPQHLNLRLLLGPLLKASWAPCIMSAS